MTKVRADCGALVQNVDKDAKPAPSKTFKANAKKFYEEQQRQLQAWECCGKKSRKGKKVLDLEAFLTAAGDYMEARGEVVQDGARGGGAHHRPAAARRKRRSPASRERDVRALRPPKPREVRSRAPRGRAPRSAARSPSRCAARA